MLESRTSAAAYQFLRDIRNAPELILQDRQPLKAMLNGLTAALLLMDDVQGRVGTTTALTRTGSQPAASVPPAPPLPVLHSAPGTPPLAATESKQLINTRLKRPTNDCDERKPGNDYFDAAAALTRSEVLVLLDCSHGAYNIVYSLFRVPRQAPQKAQPLTLPSIHGQTQNPEVLMNVSFDPKTQLLSFFGKGRGLGDCGETGEWLFDGKQFQLVSYSSKGRCGGEAGDFLTLWQSKIEKHR